MTEKGWSMEFGNRPVPTELLTDYEQELFTKPGRASVNVQWKNVDMCADVSCECGAWVHVDGYHFGEWKCWSCGKAFKLAWSHTAYEVEPNDRMTVMEGEDEA